MGDLRQEFRELELLDDITKHRYNGNCSTKVTGITRGELVHSFRQWKGETYVPNSMHKDLQWTDCKPFPIEEVDANLPWEIIPDNKTGIKPIKKAPVDIFPASYYVPAKGSQKLPAMSQDTGLKLNKRVLMQENTDVGTQERQSKKAKFSNNNRDIQVSQFKGFPWNNHSCAYDALLTILLAVYTECEETWHNDIPDNNTVLEYIGDMFRQCLGSNAVHTLRNGKDIIRGHIGQQDPALGFTGSEGIDLYALCQKLLATSTNTLTKQYKCCSCRHQGVAVTLNTITWTFDKCCLFN